VPTPGGEGAGGAAGALLSPLGGGDAAGEAQLTGAAGGSEYRTIHKRGQQDTVGVWYTGGSE
jgi:hypothetical protein